MVILSIKTAFPESSNLNEVPPGNMMTFYIHINFVIEYTINVTQDILMTKQNNIKNPSLLIDIIYIYIYIYRGRERKRFERER